MADNKTNPTDVDVNAFLAGVSEQRRDESVRLIDIMRQISGYEPVMWGPSIIGFGSTHYKYDSGREGDMPLLGFSPRKSAVTIYFSEGFDRYGDLLSRLGKYKNSVSCLYINKLTDIDTAVLREMIEQSHDHYANPLEKPKTVDEYIAQIPAAARTKFDELRELVRSVLPENAEEVLSYGIVGYRINDKRARVYISGWKDHLAMYPLPADQALLGELKPFIKGKSTLWFSLDQPLPKELIEKAVRALL